MVVVTGAPVALAAAPVVLAAAKMATSGRSTVLLAVVLFGAYVGVCALVARAAQRKRRSYGAWLAIAFFVSPALAAVMVAVMAPSDKGSGRVACPRCGGPVHPVAAGCPTCGADFTIGAPAAT